MYTGFVPLKLERTMMDTYRITDGYSILGLIGRACATCWREGYDPCYWYGCESFTLDLQWTNQEFGGTCWHTVHAGTVDLRSGLQCIKKGCMKQLKHNSVSEKSGYQSVQKIYAFFTYNQLMISRSRRL